MFLNGWEIPEADDAPGSYDQISSVSRADTRNQRDAGGVAGLNLERSYDSLGLILLG
jgi:hypothetical protein